MTAEFKGKPLIKISKNTPSYNFLEGDFGKEMLKEYNSNVKSKYKDNFNLKVLTFWDNLVKGSNIPSVVLMNQILSNFNIRTANSVDVQKIIIYDKDFLKNSYVDLGVVLRNENGTNEYGANEYLARELAKQAKDRKYEFSNSNPLVFKPSDLELTLDNNSPSGLGFNIKDSANPFNAFQLSNKNNNKKFNTTDEKGMPFFDEDENRTNYTRENGLSRFSLVRYSLLCSDYLNLSDSVDDGRIVVFNDTKGGKK